MKGMFAMGSSMMIRGFAFFLFIVSIMMPVAGYAAALPDDFEETARIAETILAANPWIAGEQYLRADSFTYEKTTSTRQYRCSVSFETNTKYCRSYRMWIGYDEGSDRYYVDVVPIPPSSDFVTDTWFVIKHLTKKTVRLWESDSRRSLRRLWRKRY